MNNCPSFFNPRNPILGHTNSPWDEIIDIRIPTTPALSIPASRTINNRGARKSRAKTFQVFPVKRGTKQKNKNRRKKEGRIGRSSRGKYDTLPGVDVDREFLD